MLDAAPSLRALRGIAAKTEEITAAKKQVRRFRLCFLSSLPARWTVRE